MIIITDTRRNGQEHGFMGRLCCIATMPFLTRSFLLNGRSAVADINARAGSGFIIELVQPKFSGFLHDGALVTALPWISYNDWKAKSMNLERLCRSGD